MSRIDEVIRELCPNGVPFVPLAQTCRIFSGFAFDSGQFNKAGDGIPLVRVRDVNTGFSGTFYSGSYDLRFLVNDGDLLIGMDGDFRAVRWSHGRALLNQRVCRLQDFANDVDPLFLIHSVGQLLRRMQEQTQSSTVRHLSSMALAKAHVAKPPIQLQREIVRALDALQSRQTLLETALAGELGARRQQYAFRRDQLFDQRDIGRENSLPLGDLGTFVRGRRFTKDDRVSIGIPSIHYGEIYTHYGTTARQVLSHVRDDLTSQLRYAQPGDVVIAGVGETVEDVAKAVAWLGETPVAIHDDTFSFRSELDPTYVSYFMQSSSFQSQKVRHVAQAKVKRIGSVGLGKIVIPVPPMDEQRRIVAILDELDSAVQELSTQLSAELVARRQQYEHYRDRLLTFKELPA